MPDRLSAPDHPDGRQPSPSQILARAQADRQVVQDFTPLPDSLEWQLGQSYLQQRGNRAFINDPEPVPFVINNDGNLSRQAAEVFFAHLRAVEETGPLEADLFVLELGIGVGLFARFFLDTFRQLCFEHGKDYYDRLCYVAGDYSPPMLRDAARHGIFANHAGHYVLRRVNALAPEASLAKDPLFGEHGAKPFRAVFLNYLLDCLPATVLRFEDQRVHQLHVRTCLARGADLRDYGGLTVEELARIAGSTDPRDQEELRRVSGLLASEYDFRPVDIAAVPFGSMAVQFARAANQRSILHNYGALQCLERLLWMLREPGLILVNDYGQAQAESAEDFQHQRFSQSTFVGINFPLLKGFITLSPPAVQVEPDESDNPSIHARLLGQELPPRTVECFQKLFGKEARENLQRPVQQARGLVTAGRSELALAAYQQGLREQPYNWLLMNEVAHFLTFGLRNPVSGLEMGKAALACNPSCSADLWNTVGDTLYELDRVEESRQAFLRALQINPDDIRTRTNLAFVHVRTKEYAEAMRRIAEGLVLDKAGSYREVLLKKQAEVLSLLARRSHQEYHRLVNRVSTRLEQQPPEIAKPTDVGPAVATDRLAAPPSHTARREPSAGEAAVG